MSWELVATILFGLAGFIFGGYAVKCRKELGEAKDALHNLIVYTHLAFSDLTLTDVERVNISILLSLAEKECRDVAERATEVASIFAKKGKEKVLWTVQKENRGA